MRSIKVNGRSAFYRTDRQTGNEVFLEERIAACDRDDDDDCHRHTGALFWHRVHVLCRGNAKRRVVCHHINISLYVIQQSLQGIQLGIADVQGRLEPVVPVTEGEEQGDRCHQRFRQRQGDLSENLELGCSVDLCRLNDGFRNVGLEERFTDNNVERRNTKRKDQRPDTVFQVEELCVNYIRRNHTTIEDHWNKNDHGEESVQFVGASGKNVTHQHRKGNSDYRTDNRYRNGNAKCSHNHLSFPKKEFVGIQRVCTRDKLVAIHLDRMLGRNRDHEDEYHRDNAGQGEDHKNNIENCICRSLDLI